MPSGMQENVTDREQGGDPPTNRRWWCPKGQAGSSSHMPRGLPRAWTMATVGAIAFLGSCDTVATLPGSSAVTAETAGRQCHLIVWIKAFINPWATDAKHVTHVLSPSIHEGEPALQSIILGDFVG